MCGSLRVGKKLGDLHQRAGNEGATESCIRQDWSEEEGVSAKTCQHARKKKVRVTKVSKVSECRKSEW
jgi:hypothetical protein